MRFNQHNKANVSPYISQWRYHFGSWFASGSLCIVILLFAFVSTVQARGSLQGRECHLTPDETIEGTLFVLCEELLIEGHVTGNLIGMAVRSQIEGRIDGNIYVGGGQMDVSGVVMGDVHFGGPVLRVHATGQTDSTGKRISPLNGSVFAATLSTTLDEGTRVPGSVINLGYQLLVEGAVGDEVNFWGSALVVSGPIAGDVYANVGDPTSDGSQIETLLLPFAFDIALVNPGLVVPESGRIDGTLRYTGPQEGNIEGQLRNDPLFTQTDVVVLPTLEEPGTLTIYANQLLQEASTLLVIGFIGFLAIPNLMQRPLRHLRFRPFPCFSVGMLTFILSFPVILISLVISLLILIVLQLLGLSGITVAMTVLLGLLTFGGGSIFYFVAIFVTRIIVGLWIGRGILRLMWGRTPYNRFAMAASLVLGIAALSLAGSLPVIGWVFNATALFLGLGAILTSLMLEFRQWRDRGQSTVPVTYPISSAVVRGTREQLSHPLAIPLPDGNADDDEPFFNDPTPTTPRPPSVNPAPGMQNLPEGFDMRFFEDD